MMYDVGQFCHHQVSFVCACACFLLPLKGMKVHYQ